MNTTSQQKALNRTNFEVVSGTSLTIEFGIYVNTTSGKEILYTNEDAATASIRVVNKTRPNVPIQIIGGIAIASSGIFNFSGLTFVTEPGNFFKIELKFNYTSDSKGTETKEYYYNVKTRLCARGESWTASNKCTLCSLGTYNLIPMTKVGECSVCEIGSTCYGKDVLAPKDNYWRPDIDKPEFIQCLNQ